MLKATAHRIGDINQIAIEFALCAKLPRVWNEQLGSLFLWVAGQPVGNTEEIEMISIGLGSLWESAVDTTNGPDFNLAPNAPSDELQRIMEARYGDEEATDDLHLAKYEVLPPYTGPFFDGWEAVLLPSGESERFIFQQTNASAREITWRRRTFHSVITEARARFEMIARGVISRPGRNVI